MKINLVFNGDHAAGTVKVQYGTLISSSEIPENCRVFSVEADDLNLENGSLASILSVNIKPYPFACFVRDITSEYPIYIPDAGCAVLPDGDNRSYDDIADEIRSAGLLSDFQRMESEPEESYENACRRNRNQTVPIWLGLARDLRIFQVDAQEDTQMWGHVVALYHSQEQIYEAPEVPMSYLRDIYFNIGPGANCSPLLTRRLDNGVLPIVHAVQKEENIEYRVTVFASLETAPVSNARVRGSKPLPALSQMNYSMLTSDEKKILESEIPAETRKREEEVILFVHVEAFNKGRTPDYAWFKAPYTRKGKAFADGLSLENGEAFAASLLNGKPAADSELAVMVKPDDSVIWECRIFHTPVAPERAKNIFSQDFNAHLEGVRSYWQGKLDKAASINIPEKEVYERIRAGLLHLDLNTYGMNENGPLLPAVGSYSPIGTESSPIIQFYDTMGWHKEAERCIDFFISRQRDDGFIQVYNNYESETGPILWTAAEHFRMTQDIDWLKRVTPALKKSCDYLLSWRNKNKIEEFRKTGGYGLLNGKVADPDDFYHSFFLNAGTLIGLESMADVLVLSDPDYASMLKNELADYRQDLINAIYFAQSNSPVVPLQDGSWVPQLPPWTEYHGNVALYADGGEWFSHGAFASRSSLIGALFFALSDLFAPDSQMMTTLLKGNQHPITRENAALSQPYYCRHDIAHLRRGEVKLFLKAFYNQFTALQDRQTYTFWEHYYHLTSHKTHEEAWFLMQCRWMLAYEEKNTLELFRCIPRKWLENGKRVEIKTLVTHFGKLNAMIVSYGDMMEVSVDVERLPESIEIRIPHCEEKVAKKVSCGNYDAENETVSFCGTKNIRFVAEF